jgi:hypothetical protein
MKYTKKEGKNMEETVYLTTIALLNEEELSEVMKGIKDKEIPSVTKTSKVNNITYIHFITENAVERPQKPIECLFKYKKTSRSKAIKYVTKE